MKKLAAVVSAALVVAMAAPVVVAGPTLSGSLEGKITWNQGQDPQSGANLDLKLGFQAGDRTKAVLELSPVIDDQNAWGVDIDNIGITKAYVETQGPWFNGGPEVTTRLGDLDIDYSPYVATIHSTEGKTRGISVSGLRIGGFDVAAFHAWDSNAGASEYRLLNGQASGARVATQIAGINLAVTGVVEGEDAAVAVEGSTQVLPNVTLGGALARDFAHRANLYRVNAAIQPVSNLTLKAEYGRVPSIYAPLYAYENDDDSFVTQTRGKAVIGLNAQTQQAGFNLGAGVKLARAEGARQFSRTETTFTAGRSVSLMGMPVEANYTLTIDGNNQIKHELAGKTTLSLVPQLQNVTLDGRVTMQNSELTYEANAGYTAPNGMTFGLHYASQATDTLPAGLSADAGLKVEF
ncbi:MAG: hypothetical protein IMX00_05600 [Limnochordales bacterium]|nr:hypothetical protein [Limnochordales bacterium]